MIAVLEAGLTELDRMVAVTFTETAAGELKLGFARRSRRPGSTRTKRGRP
jgi:ATP-dependent exoDNAse (exonuclease V) beta subunit